MPWYFPWSDSIKKRACRYLLQRYLGHFLKEKLTLDQLSLDLYNGKGTMKDLLLDVVSLNEALDSYNVPFEIVDGFIGSMTVDIPWSALVNANTYVEIHNLELTIQPKQRDDQAGVMLESMLPSMTSSLELAQECLKQQPTEGEQHADSAQPFEGLEMFAMTIEAVLSRIKIRFSDTVIRLEHLPKDAKSGAAVELRIARIDYFDDIANDPGSSVDKPGSDSKLYQTPAIAHKNIHLMGINLFCDEFPAIHRTVSRLISLDNSTVKEPQSAYSMSISPPFTLNLDEKQTGCDSESEVKDSDPIKIAVMSGKQELKLKIKQNEELVGPKIEVEAQLGIINVHLSPRQVHLIMQIVQGLITPDDCDRSNVCPRHAVSRPMDPDDEERVEQELQKRLQTDRLVQYGSPDWESGESFANQCLDDSEEDMYFDLDSQSVSMSMTSSTSSSATIKSSSSMSSYYQKSGFGRRDTPFLSTIPRSGLSKPTRKHKESLHKLLDDTASQLAKLKLRVSFISIVILHEDPPTTPGDALDPEQTSMEKLHIMSDKYFGRIHGINTSGYNTELASLRIEFSQACGVDHISLLAKSIILESTQRASSSTTTTEAELTIGLAEIVEALFDHRGATAATASLLGIHIPLEHIPPQFSELLIFLQDEIPKNQSMFSSIHNSAGPCVRLKFTTGQKIHHTGRRQSSTSVPKTVISVELAKCISELDISIVDRIHAILNPQSQTKVSNSVYVSAYKSFTTINQSHHTLFSQTIDDTPTASDKPLDFRISSHNCTLVLRFPIPDLRQSQGVDKPWWRRCLHPEKLLLQVIDGEFHTRQQGLPTSEMDFTCREIRALFQDDPNKTPVPFILVTKADSSMHDRDDSFDWPRLELKMFTKIQSQLEQVLEEVEDPHADSDNGACQFDVPSMSPFSNKKVLYDNDELVLPGDRQETAEFQEQAMAKTQMSLDLTLPNVNIYFVNKDFFELIYNRVLNDLVLWEPVAPSPLDINQPYSFSRGPGWSVENVTPFMNNQGHETFSICKSGIQYDSSSDEEEDRTNEFFSTNECRSRQNRKSPERGGKSKLCLTLNINRGRLIANVPCKGEDGLAKAGYHGELCLDVADCLFFTVVQTNGDPELQHMCIHVNKAALYHADEAVDRPAPALTRVSPMMVPPAHLLATMYMTEASQSSQHSDTENQDMLSIAVQIKIDLATNVEECIVSLGVSGTTLHHKMLPVNHSWFDQLVDLFDVRDFPVLGYVKPAVLTQLHAHLYNCSIDYRPLHLPYRVLVSLETFSICSNVVAESPTSKLRFRIEDGALYISNKCQAKDCDLRRDYVCVADVGLFEIIMTTSDGKDPKYPKLDLRASNNIVHIRTCSDSCHALAEIINYLADNGDLVNDNVTPTTSVIERSGSTATLSDSPLLNQSHMNHVHDMMADAMKESCISSQHQAQVAEAEKLSSLNPVQVFFFPGEDKVKTNLPDRTDAKLTSDPQLPITDNDDDSDNEIISKNIEPKRKEEYFSDSDNDSDEDFREAMTKEIRLEIDLDEDDDADADDDYDVEEQDKEQNNDSRNEYDSEDSIEKSLSQLVPSGGISRHVDDHVQFEQSGDELEAIGDTYSGDDEFCIIDDPGLGVASKDGQPVIRVLTDKPIKIVDNHFEMPLGKVDMLKAPKHFPQPVYRYTLKEMSLVWYIYGGRDFTSSKQSLPKSNLGAKQRQNLGKAAWQARGGPDRDIDTLIELQLSKVRLQHEIYPENTEQASRQILLIHDVEIRDRLAMSKINKFLYQYSSDSMPKQSHANMVMLKAVHLRPDPTQPAVECSLQISLQALRLNIDQDAMFFLRKFFEELSHGGESMEKPIPTPDVVHTPLHKASSSQPVMMVAQGETEPSPEDHIKFDELGSLGEDDDSLGEDDGETDASLGEELQQEQPIFFKSFIFSPDVPIRLDYHGKRVDMEQGTLTGLLVGLAQLNCSELKLKRLHHRHGLLGVRRLVMYMVNEWLKDIKRNQLPSILGGIGPMHSLVQLIQGVRDLFWLPVEQYQRDGRIIRGLQRGAHSFATCTAMSALEITNRAVQGVQYCAEVAFDMVSPGPSVRKRKSRHRIRRMTHPADLREGVCNAYSVVTQGFVSTAQTIYHAALDQHEQKGVTGAVGGVLRQLPPTVLQPVLIATEATSNVLGGMRNQLLPDKKKEDDEKWMPEDDD